MVLKPNSTYNIEAGNTPLAITRKVSAKATPTLTRNKTSKIPTKALIVSFRR